MVCDVKLGRTIVFVSRRGRGRGQGRHLHHVAEAHHLLQGVLFCVFFGGGVGGQNGREHRSSPRRRSIRHPTPIPQPPTHTPTHTHICKHPHTRPIPASPATPPAPARPPPPPASSARPPPPTPLSALAAHRPLRRRRPVGGRTPGGAGPIYGVEGVGQGVQQDGVDGSLVCIWFVWCVGVVGWAGGCLLLIDAILSPTLPPLDQSSSPLCSVSHPPTYQQQGRGAVLLQHGGEPEGGQHCASPVHHLVIYLCVLLCGVCGWVGEGVGVGVCVCVVCVAAAWVDGWVDGRMN